jgi:hypothetical protein
VDADGAFSTAVSGKTPQILIVAEGSVRPQGVLDLVIDKVRAVALHIPGTSDFLYIGAEMTAVSVVFLTFGILTLDPVEALARVSRIRSLPSFSAFREYVAAQLPVKTLGELGPDNTFQSLKQGVIDAYFTPEPIKAREFTEEEKEKLRLQGLIWADKGGLVGDGLPILFENYGFRFVSVIRRELGAGDQELFTPVKPNLIGSLQPGDAPRNLLGGHNSLSWGSLFTDIATAPGGGKDYLDPGHSESNTVEYWSYGPGRGLGDQFQLPASIPITEFGASSHTLTGFFYFILPLFDIFCGGLGSLALRGNAEVLAELFDLFLAPGFGGAAAAVQVDANYRTADAKGITSAWADFLAAMVAGVTSWGTVMVAGVPAGELVGGTLAAAAGLELLAATLTVGGVVFALANFSVAVRHHLKLPMLTRVPVKLKETDYELAYSTTALANISWMSLNRSGHVAVTDHTRNGIGGVWMRTDGDFTLVKTLGPGSPGYSQFRVFLNQNGDLAWGDRERISDVLQDVCYYKRSGEATVLLHQVPREIVVCGLQDRDALGDTTFYGVRTPAPVGLTYSQLQGLGTLDLLVPGAPADSFLDLRINQKGQALVIIAGAGFSRQLLYQAPIGEAEESLEVIGGDEVTVEGLIGINERGDCAYGYYDVGTASSIVVVRRAGQAESQRLNVPRIGGMTSLAINDGGDVFVTGIDRDTGKSVFLKFPPQGEPVDLGGLLLQEYSDYTITAMDAEADSVAVGLTDVTGNQFALLLFKARL